MSSDETTNAGEVTDAGEPSSTDTGTGTPLFDATARALAAAQTADATSASTETNPADTATGGIVGSASEPATTGQEDWVDQGYGDPAKPTPMMDPDSPEGAAILGLFRQIKDIEESNGRWPAVDVVAQLTTWFTALGINPDEQPGQARQRLRLARQDGVAGQSVGTVYGVRIGTHHDDPELIVRTALHVLARQLGPGTSIELVSHDRAVLARLEHPHGPTAGS